MLNLLIFSLIKACTNHGGLFVLKLTDRGFEQAWVAEAEFILMPIAMASVWIIAPFVRRKPLIFLFPIAIATTLVNVASGLILYYYEDITENIKIIYFVVAGIDHVFTAAYYVTLGSFFALVGDERIGGTYLSFLWSINNFSQKIWDTWLTWFTGKLESHKMFEGKSNNSELAFESHQLEPYHVTLIFPLLAALLWFLTQSKTVFRLQKLAFDNSAWLVNSENVPAKLKSFFVEKSTAEEKVVFKESTK